MPSPKARGELAEARFLARAMELGFTVSKPFGDSARYDFIVDAGRGRLHRIQVKSAWKIARHGGYQFGASPAQLKNQRARPYRRDEIDFLVACIVPEDSWYIIPVRAISTRNHLFLPANSRPHPLARYRDAWHLLTTQPSLVKPCRPPRLFSYVIPSEGARPSREPPLSEVEGDPYSVRSTKNCLPAFRSAMPGPCSPDVHRVAQRRQFIAQDVSPGKVNEEISGVPQGRHGVPAAARAGIILVRDFAGDPGLKPRATEPGASTVQARTARFFLPSLTGLGEG